MRIARSLVLSAPLAMALIACSSGFGAGQGAGPGGADASDEQSTGIRGTGAGDGGGQDGSSGDATAGDTGTAPGDDGGTVTEAGDEPPFVCPTGSQVCNGNSCVPVADGTNGVFVSPSGGGGLCTEAAPCNSIQAAVENAVGYGKTIVYLDKGTYTEQLLLENENTNPPPITIQGGWTFAGGNWTTCNNGALASSIISAPAGDNITILSAGGPWTLDTLSIDEPNTPPAGASISDVYGISNVPLGAGPLTLTNVAIQVAAGGAGAAGTQGPSGTTPTGNCTPSCAAPGAAGATGAGGSQDTYVNGGPSYYGNGSMGLGPGGTGCNGTAGGNGTSFTTCGLALDGNGCGNTPDSSGPGNPGCGGGGGGPGLGGIGGGPTIGVVAASGSITFLAGVTIRTGNGGAGGPGGPGGAGGMPSPPSTGTPATERSGCVNTPVGCKPVGTEDPCSCTLGTQTTVPGGTPGGPGAMGASGGAGGGGAGGDSLCYSYGGVATVTGTPTCMAGAGGVGGLDGNGGTAGQGATGRSGMHN
jgi:hypothetical protein